MAVLDLRLKTPPAHLPVSLADAKGICRVEGHSEDALIMLMVQAAVAHLDGWSGILGRCLISQVWEQDRDECDPFEAPFPDVSGVAEETTDGVTTATFTAGYGGPSDVPAPIRSAILNHVVLLYEHRGLVEVGSVTTPHYEQMIKPYRVMHQ